MKVEKVIKGKDGKVTIEVWDKGQKTEYKPKQGKAGEIGQMIAAGQIREGQTELPFPDLWEQIVEEGEKAPETGIRPQYDERLEVTEAEAVGLRFKIGKFYGAEKKSGRNTVTCSVRPIEREGHRGIIVMFDEDKGDKRVTAELIPKEKFLDIYVEELRGTEKVRCGRFHIPPDPNFMGFLEQYHGEGVDPNKRKYFIFDVPETTLSDKEEEALISYYSRAGKQRADRSAKLTRSEFKKVLHPPPSDEYVRGWEEVAVRWGLEGLRHFEMDPELKVIATRIFCTLASDMDSFVHDTNALAREAIWFRERVPEKIWKPWTRKRE
jgi:hypothetical protein